MRIVLNLNSFGVMWNSWGTETAAGHWLLHSSTASSSSSSSYHHDHHQAGRWFEVGKEASPKKRLEKVTMRKEKRKNMRKKRVSKKNFHRDEENEEEEDDDQEEKGNNNISNSFNGGGGRGSVMEGSRCSRVNGRGWRCCQQTLVGYALCEHHLGKGRLRSMLNVRSRSSSNAVDNNISNDYSGEDCRLLPLSCRIWEDGDQGGEEEKIMMTKEKKKNKRKRIGMVKARSISSLLCQTHQAASSLQQQQRCTSNSNDVLP